MSLTQEDRDTMIKLYLERAFLFMSKADEYFGNGDYLTAANRYYYACFHAVHALFVKEGLYTRTHEGLNVQFSLHFVKTGRFETKFGSLVATMEHLRDKADYNVLFDVTKEDLEHMRPEIHELLDKIQKELS